MEEKGTGFQVIPPRGHGPFHCQGALRDSHRNAAPDPRKPLPGPGLGTSASSGSRRQPAAPAERAMSSVSEKDDALSAEQTEERELKIENKVEDSEEEEEEEEEKEKSLIVEGKREKKKVERLTMQVSSLQKEPFTITPGKGQKLCEIERIQYFLSKKKTDELRNLHKLLYNRPGTVASLKKNVGQFSGFPFEKGSDLYKKKEEMLKK
ncbi:hypothetical protein lerEdw1_007151 [Lerista edwardsae]|nr:hypothetical protein lerEdw1_007151 [Lerista edwardsae]